ncbi:putative transferase CAF17 homolog, mitochondrial [Hyposmocoma kahamanoa]|uniref:putative transferase CAF17 homolog, mitochondrial n=1 Tax=Hyposmocoma kahamanoa TaxID=1477025 RepID=UPI000E6D933F|nr:putative transferase CAF17 homolog, mitochondrial [Hyposmocoma kahamanoa]
MFRQVNRLFAQTCIVRGILQHSRNEFCSTALVQLRSKKLLKVSGADASDFLQGLITNDMGHFNDGAKCMYAMFLNNKGRVLYDSLIYKWDENSFLLECQRSVFDSLLRHLSLYKLKRNILFDDASAGYDVWTLISTVNTPLPEITFDPKSHINLFADPRLKELGCRLITINSLDAATLTELFGKNVILKDEDVYRYARYKLGVGEGPDELPPGACFPLEVNCDYLHGVSFHKGCYVGQELTARIHHTGVVRKRLMPLRFIEQIGVLENIDKEEAIVPARNSKGKIGVLRGFVQDFGIGLLRIKDAIEAGTVKMSNYTAEVIKPSWWPVEAPKEKINVT